MPVYQIGQGNNFRSLLFVGVPRTGTVAIDKTLRKHGWKGYYGTELDAITDFHKSPALHFHAEISAFIFNFDMFNDLFMVHRNPYERFMSLNLKIADNVPKCNKSDIDVLAEYMEKYYEKTNFVFMNYVRPQNEFIVPHARLFPYENDLTPVLEDVYDKVGVVTKDGKSPIVPPVNVSRHRVGLTVADFEPTQKTIDRLRRFYEKDFERFGYSDSWIDFVERTGAGRKDSDDGGGITASGLPRPVRTQSGLENGTLINVFLTDTYLPWAELFLDALRFQHGESFPVRLDTRDLDDAAMARLRARYGNLEIHNSHIDWREAARSLDMAPEQVPALKKTVATGNLSNDDRLSLRLKMFFSVDQRYRALPGILAAARQAGMSRVVHCDVDVYIRGSLAPVLAEIADADLGLFMNHLWPDHRYLHAWGGFLGFNLEGWAETFVQRWAMHIDAVPGKERPRGFGQTSLGQTLKESADLAVADLTDSGPSPMFSRTHHKNATLWTGTPAGAAEFMSKSTGVEQCRADLEARGGPGAGDIRASYSALREA